MLWKYDIIKIKSFLVFSTAISEKNLLLCRKCHDVRFETAMGMVNTLKKAQLDGTLIRKMKLYTYPVLALI